jgi:hypothetical protein
VRAKRSPPPPPSPPKKTKTTHVTWQSTLAEGAPSSQAAIAEKGKGKENKFLSFSGFISLLI